MLVIYLSHHNELWIVDYIFIGGNYNTETSAITGLQQVNKLCKIDHPGNYQYRFP